MEIVHRTGRSRDGISCTRQVDLDDADAAAQAA
jgi:hypothetical protein